MSKLNTNSNSYIIIYSAILVVIVAFLLAFVYQALKPMQDANVALDVKKQILYSLNIRGLDGAEAEAKYNEVVKEEKDLEGQKVYECVVDGQDLVVTSLKGMGLWGGISGYIAIDNDVVLSIVKKVDDPSTQVDCVTGATLTSNGVDAMIKDGLKNVKNYAIGKLLESIASSDSTIVEPKAEEE